MIFYTVGTQLPFDRLTKMIDKFAETSDIEIFGQIGNTDYKPKNFEYCKQLEVADFERKFDSASIIISHAGMGTILQSLVKGKKIAITARLSKYNEHRNDHQLATLKRFIDFDGVYEINKLEDIQNIVTNAESHDNSNLSQWAPTDMIENLKALLSDL